MSSTIESIRLAPPKTTIKKLSLQSAPVPVRLRVFKAGPPGPKGDKGESVDIDGGEY